MWLVLPSGCTTVTVVSLVVLVVWYTEPSAPVTADLVIVAFGSRTGAYCLGSTGTSLISTVMSWVPSLAMTLNDTVMPSALMPAGRFCAELYSPTRSLAVGSNDHAPVTGSTVTLPIVGSIGWFGSRR